MSTERETKRRALLDEARSWDSIEISTDETGVTIHHSVLGLSYQHSLITGPLAHRATQSRQAILKACNNKTRNIQAVLDLTAGWGGDGLALAYHGQTVTWLEHHPLIHAVLDYSLLLLRSDINATNIAKQLHLESSHALDFLESLPESHGFDCIYLDPMFPAHKSGAKPGKDLQILQHLTENRGIDDCFHLALQKAHRRVVVKRPLKSASLSHASPDFSCREKTIRFDVYLTN